MLCYVIVVLLLIQITELSFSSLCHWLNNWCLFVASFSITLYILNVYFTLRFLFRFFRVYRSSSIEWQHQEKPNLVVTHFPFIPQNSFSILFHQPRHKTHTSTHTHKMIILHMKNSSNIEILNHVHIISQ